MVWWQVAVMNKRFCLSEEKRQEQILGAGSKGVAQNTDGKTSMSMVAEEADKCIR